MCSFITSYPTLCKPMDCSPPGSSVHEILQVRILEWAVISSSGDLPNPGIEPASLVSPALAGRFFTTSVTWEAWATRWPSENISEALTSLVIEITPSIHVISIRTGPSVQDMTLVSISYTPKRVKLCARWRIRIRRKGLLFRSSQIHWGEKVHTCSSHVIVPGLCAFIKVPGMF